MMLCKICQKKRAFRRRHLSKLMPYITETASWGPNTSQCIEKCLENSIFHNTGLQVNTALLCISQISEFREGKTTFSLKRWGKKKSHFLWKAGNLFVCRDCTCAHLSSRQNEHGCGGAREPGRRQEAEDQECDWFRESRIFSNFAALLLPFLAEIWCPYILVNPHICLFRSELNNSFNFSSLFLVIFNCLSLTDENQRVEFPIRSTVEFIEAASFLITIG